MIIYKDVITGDELFSDVYPMKVIDGVFFEIEGKHVTKKIDEISDAAIGGNASAEEQAEQLDETAVSGINIVLDNRLVETGFGTKKEYQSYLKEYMAKIVSHLEKEKPERIDEFKKEASTAVKKILPNFKDLQFFMGESMDPEGMHVICLLYTSPSPRDRQKSRMPSSA